MKNIVIINGISISPYAHKPLKGDQNAIDLTCDFGRSLPDVKKIVILASHPLEKDIEVIEGKEWDTRELLTAMDSLGKGYDTIFYFYCDCPFLDKNLAEKMYENHRTYMTDYTFADGYPYGLTPEIMKSDIIKRFLVLNKDEQKPVTRQSLFDIVKTDINSFDIETELAPKDQRLLRVRLCADTKRDFSLIKKIAEKGAWEALAVCSLLDKEPGILRTLPSYAGIQITRACPQVCSYCPYPLFGKKEGREITEQKEEMSLERFTEIIDKIEDFCEDAVIGLSPWGEPGLHSRIGDIAVAVASRPSLSLLIETSGVGWDQDALLQVAGIKENPPRWIISLDAWTADVYESLRGSGFNEAYKTAETLLDTCGDTVYLQAVRMKENEDNLEHFYLNWKKKTDHIIIQKYDHFAGNLPERKVTDLSPLHRFPCWHNKRDLSILIDGSVPICREDIEGSMILGNIFSSTLPEIWEKGGELYQKQITGEYPDICGKCDEYYTFNF